MTLNLFRNLYPQAHQGPVVFHPLLEGDGQDPDPFPLADESTDENGNKIAN